MIVTVFRSRLRPENAAEYSNSAAEMSAAAKAMPGYVSHKVFTAEDGERVTIVEFTSAETNHAWATHPGHCAMQQRGREGFYSEYDIKVCEVLSSRKFALET